uniref:Uncharacterized protein n=1 Tax=Rhizophora mucronata TaxID=61149 RepID=A0A2P2P1L2_RHIMU
MFHMHVFNFCECTSRFLGPFFVNFP